MGTIILSGLLVAISIFWSGKCSANYLDDQLKKSGMQLPNTLEGIEKLLLDTPERERRETEESKFLGVNSISNNTKVTHVTATASRSPTCLNGKRTLSTFLTPSNQRIFIGLCHENGKVELILPSTQDPRKKDFVVLENIQITKSSASTETLKPVVKSASETQCITCHQNKGAHLSFSPWSEFEGPTDDLILYDGAVRIDSARTQLAQACREMCGKDITCRRYLLLSALIGGAQEAGLGAPLISRRQGQLNVFDDDNSAYNLVNLDDEDFKKKYLTPLTRSSLPKYHDDFQRRLEKTWPKNGFGQISSVLLDRSVTPTHETGVRLPYVDAQGIEHLDKEGTYNEAQVLNIRISGHTALRADESEQSLLLDAVNKRPRIRQIPKNLAALFAETYGTSCLGLSRTESSYLALQDRNQIAAIVQAGQLDELLKQEHADGAWNIQGRALMAALVTKIRSNAPTDTGESSLSEHATLESVKTLKGTAGRKPTSGEAQLALGLVSNHCSDCHGSDSDSKFKISSDFSDLQSYRGRSGRYKGLSIKEILEKSWMPPPADSDLTTGKKRTTDNEILSSQSRQFLKDTLDKSLP